MREWWPSVMAATSWVPLLGWKIVTNGLWSVNLRLRKYILSELLHSKHNFQCLLLYLGIINFVLQLSTYVKHKPQVFLCLLLGVCETSLHQFPLGLHHMLDSTVTRGHNVSVYIRWCQGSFNCFYSVHVLTGPVPLCNKSLRTAWLVANPGMKWS